MAQVARALFGAVFIAGSFVHVMTVLSRPELYAAFGNTALIPFVRELWSRLVMPNIMFFVFLLAALELTTGLLIYSRGVWVRVGLAASIIFNLFLVQLGLASPGTGLSAFVMNRLPNLLWGALQVPLLWATFDRSLPSVVASAVQRVLK